MNLFPECLYYSFVQLLRVGITLLHIHEDITLTCVLDWLPHHRLTFDGEYVSYAMALL